MPDTKPPLLEVCNATLWRGRTRVFESLNLSIEQGESVAILGANGAGKTTLLKAINRELYPVRAPDAYLRILGRDRWNVWQLRQQIGIVSNDLHLRFPPDSVVLDTVLSGFHSSIGVHGNIADRVSDDQRRRVVKALAETGLEGFATRQLQTLSTGQQRRVLLARALVHNPRTLILDEPTTGMDLAASFEHMRNIATLADRGCNIILVTHKIGEIPPFIDRVILLQAGRILADGTKADVLTSAMLSRAYETSVQIAQAGDYYLPYPGDGETKPK